MISEHSAKVAVPFEIELMVFLIIMYFCKKVMFGLKDCFFRSNISDSGKEKND